VQKYSFYDLKNTVLRRYESVSNEQKPLSDMQIVNYQTNTKSLNPCVFMSQQQVKRFRWHSREIPSDFLTTVKLTI